MHISPHVSFLHTYPCRVITPNIRPTPARQKGGTLISPHHLLSVRPLTLSPQRADDVVAEGHLDLFIGGRLSPCALHLRLAHVPHHKRSERWSFAHLQVIFGRKQMEYCLAGILCAPLYSMGRRSWKRVDRGCISLSLQLPRATR